MSIDNVPLPFEVPANGGSRKEKQASPRSVRWGRCPGCQRGVPEAKLIGLVQQGGHLVWRIHDIVTLSGARMQCPASGTRWCENYAGDDHLCICRAAQRAFGTHK